MRKWGLENVIEYISDKSSILNNRFTDLAFLLSFNPNELEVVFNGLVDLELGRGVLLDSILRCGDSKCTYIYDHR